jgi:uncharacterized protein (TIGR02611 family)
MSAQEPSGAPPEEPSDPPGPDWLYRYRMRVTGDSAYRRIMWRIVVTALGGAILLAGVLMLVLPGPGWAVIFLGLAVLATEYAWAHRLLVLTKDKAQGAASAAFDPKRRRRNIWLLIITLLVVASVVSWYVYRYGWTPDVALGWIGLD